MTNGKIQLALVNQVQMSHVRALVVAVLFDAKSALTTPSVICALTTTVVTVTIIPKALVEPVLPTDL